MFIFDRCRRSSAAVTPVKYECDANNLTGTSERSKILLTEKLTNGALLTPTPEHLWPQYHCLFLQQPHILAVRNMSTFYALRNSNSLLYQPGGFYYNKAFEFEFFSICGVRGNVNQTCIFYPWHWDQEASWYPSLLKTMTYQLNTVHDCWCHGDKGS